MLVNLAYKTTMEKELKDQRIAVMLTPSELKAIDDWSFSERIRSRGEAIRRLLAFALSARSELEPYVTIAHNGLEYDQRELLGKIVKLLQDTHPVGHYFGDDTENPSE